MYWQMPTIAVLGFGHNHHYPKETAQVRQYIEQNGIVISEYLPDDPPKNITFLNVTELLAVYLKVS